MGIDTPWGQGRQGRAGAIDILDHLFSFSIAGLHFLHCTRDKKNRRSDPYPSSRIVFSSLMTVT